MLNTGADHHIGDQFRSDWSSRFILLVLTGIGKMRELKSRGTKNQAKNVRGRGHTHDSCYPTCTSDLASVSHDERFHQGHIGRHDRRRCGAANQFCVKRCTGVRVDRDRLYDVDVCFSNGFLQLERYFAGRISQAMRRSQRYA